MELTRYLTVNEVASLTGYSAHHVYVALQRGDLHGFKSGPGHKTHWRITVDAVTDWMEGRNAA